jgi:hypothetical protein
MRVTDVSSSLVGIGATLRETIDSGLVSQPDPAAGSNVEPAMKTTGNAAAAPIDVITM